MHLNEDTMGGVMIGPLRWFCRDYSCLVAFLVIVSGIGDVLASPGQEPTLQESKARAYLQERQFKVVLVGEIKDPDVSHIGFTNYKAKDGATATLIHYEFPSPTSARDYLEKRLSRDKKLRIIERGNKMDRKKVSVGMRVYAEFASDSSSAPMQDILWTNGSNFYEVTAISLKDALAFENAFT
jgi:hypothetical protein